MVTSCDKIITLGELSNFIGDYIHSSSNDAVIHVDMSKGAAYCPTYSEILGMLPLSNQGTHPTLDVDGIIINGSYDNNQCVRQGDISLKYTVFKSLEISASKTIFQYNQGGTSTLSKTLIYTRGEKKWDSTCSNANVTTSDVVDTVNSAVTWVQSPITIGVINFPTFTVLSASTTAETYVDAYTTHNGVNHYANENIKFILTGLSCDCSSLTLATTIINWDSDDDNEKYMRYDADDCINHISSTVDNNHFATIVNASEHKIYVIPIDVNTGMTNISGTVAVSYNADSTLCPSGRTFIVNHKGKTCSCDNFTLSDNELTWGNTESSEQSITYSADECIPITSITVSSDSTHFTASVDTGTTKIKIKPTTANTGTTAIISTVKVSYKSGTNDCSKNITVIHYATDCNCDLNLDGSEITWAYSSETQSCMTFTASDCLNTITATSSNAHFTVTVDSSPTNKKICVTPTSKNTGTTVINGVITVNSQNGSTPCPSKTFNVTHNINGCSCDSLSCDTSTITFAFDESGVTKNKSYTIEPCVTSVTASIDNTTNFECNIDTTNKEIYVKARDKNLTNTPYSGTVTVTYDTGGTTTCTKTFTVKQNTEACDCSNFSFSTTALTFAHSAKSVSDAQTVIISESGVCINTVAISVTSGDSAFTASLAGNVITVYPKSENESTDARNGEITVSYKADTTPCTSKKITLKQNGSDIPDCNCDNIVIEEI